MRSRIRNLKQSLVRVWVNGAPCGSGFVAGRRGQVLTCFHVVQVLTPLPANPQQAQIGIAATIEVECPGGQRYPATPHPNCLNQGFQAAIAADFMVLNAPTLTAPALALGAFNTVDEGDDVYLGGFPLAIEQPVFARGLLSTKWLAPTHLTQPGPARDVAWLDITMNRGNSGGPVLRLAPAETDDAVIGIASFGLNPFAADMDQVVQIAAGFPGGAAVMGVAMGPFFVTVGRALSHNSLGVGGCVSIDHAARALP